MKKNIKGIASKVLASAASLAMASTMGVGAPMALAAGVTTTASPAATTATAQTANAVTTATAVTASVTPASQTGATMLGMSDLEEPTISEGGIDLDNWAGSGYSASKTSYGSLKYIISGQASIDESADPYMVNALSGATPSVFYGKSHGATGVQMPKSCLKQYTGTTTAAQDIIWRELPDVIVGCQVDSSATQTNYKDSLNNSVALITGEQTKEGVEPIEGAENYDPQVVNYDNTSMATIIQANYDMAFAAKAIVEKSNGTKMLRYGDSNSAVDIATEYEKFIKGSQGYILSQLTANKASKKTVAVIDSYSDADKVFTLKQAGDPSASSPIDDRAIESVKNVSNIMAGDANNQCTLADLQKADLIIVKPSGTGTEQTDIAAVLGDLKSKTYWVSTAAGSSQGTTYDIMRNNSEVGQNYARLLGCLYPEYLDQSDMIAYWYKNFLHVKSSALGTVIDNAMDGVRNWDSKTSGTELTNWTAATVSDYNEAALQQKIDAGCAYLQSLSADATPDLLKLTDYVPQISISIASAKVTVTPATASYTGKAITPSTVTVALNGVTLKEGTDYTVSYANNTNAGTATVTVTGKGAYTGTATGSFDIAKAAYNIAGMTFASLTCTYDGKSHAVEVTNMPAGLSVGYLTSAAEGDGTYLGNSAIQAGVYNVTASFTGDANHAAVPSMTATLTINKAANKLTVKKATVKQGKSVALSKYVKSNSTGKVTFTATAAAKKAGLTVTSAGKVTAKKTAKKGTYKVTVKAAADFNYTAASSTVKVTVK